MATKNKENKDNKDNIKKFIDNAEALMKQEGSKYYPLRKDANQVEKS